MRFTHDSIQTNWINLQVTNEIFVTGFRIVHNGSFLELGFPVLTGDCIRKIIASDHYYQILEQGRPEQDLPAQSNDTNSFSLSVCLYWPEIFCVQSLVLSARMYVMVFQDKHMLTKWNILSNCLLVHSRERIFHFGRVCFSWKTITYIWAERTRLWTQNISGQYRHTSRENAIHEDSV